MQNNCVLIALNATLLIDSKFNIRQNLLTEKKLKDI